MVKSEYNPILTLDYILQEAENKYFDRKSAKIRPSDLAEHISGFANAEGGTLVIGITDKTRILEGINGLGADKINELVSAPKLCCRPMPSYDVEFLDITNDLGRADRLLLLHIHPAVDRVICTTSDSTFLRIADKTRELKGADLRNLEYSKSTRHYEDELNYDAQISDLDSELVGEYKKRIGAENLSTEQVLRARGFLKEKNGKQYLTNAAVLLFAENTNQFYPNCRIRFTRYSGNRAQVGTKINIEKDINIEYPILKILSKAKEFIGSQLREFTALDLSTGRFQIVPEYPEFAWLEGIVNAVTHREYGMTGSYISVQMYDDHLEIISPGKLPNLVTVNNIRETRYSRNPRIARVLTDFGWVRELNEGVKRIYSDMKEFFLDEPVYSEPEQSVKLVLKNNIIMRSVRMENSAKRNIGIEIWSRLDTVERKILAYMTSRSNITRASLAEFIGKSAATVTNRLNHLIELGIVVRIGNKNDPTQTYQVNPEFTK